TGYGGKAVWMDVTASTADEPSHPVGITIFDHPGNRRYPTPWYIWYAAGQHLFFTPSILFDGPLLLRKGEKLHLKYQTYIHDGKPTIKQMEQMSQVFGSY
ncbi:MAG TPA: PmoA family protein, partial [Agriterribacter sp.]|nr:PmoA family protein [Agriterribacter sp.]